MAIAAGVVGRALGAARVATIEVSPERGRMAAPEGRQDGVLRRRDSNASLSEQSGPEPAKDVAQRGRVSVHDEASSLCWLTLEMLDRVQGTPGPCHQFSLYVCIDSCCR